MEDAAPFHNLDRLTTLLPFGCKTGQHPWFYSAISRLSVPPRVLPAAEPAGP